MYHLVSGIAGNPYGVIFLENLSQNVSGIVSGDGLAVFDGFSGFMAGTFSTIIKFSGVGRSSLYRWGVFLHGG